MVMLNFLQSLSPSGKAVFAASSRRRTGLSLISAILAPVFLCTLTFPLGLAASAYSGNDPLLEKANRSYRSGRYQEAGGLLNRVLAGSPSPETSAGAHNLLGKVYHRLGKQDEALKQYQQALKDEPG
ncbi:MAG TPA: tetratricopeptide repeat protein, partial [Candidatus Obscuribacter sp.]|nr:tetratricopeptide repeat protein [Candidatus Obscuribacter sp.]